MKRKMTALILSLAMILSTMPTSIFAATSEPSSVVSGKTNIADIDGYDFSFDFRDLTERSNTTYSDNLGVLSILLSADFGDPGDIKVLSGDGYVLEQMGFNDVRKIDLMPKYQDEEDPNDYVVFYMGRKTISIDMVDYVIYAVAVRGTVDPEEWQSNFDIGADTEEYAKMCGQNHPDWDDHVMHKGFYVSANRVYKELEAYMEEFKSNDEGKKKSVLITGHSRGAAVANILGKMYEDLYNGGGEVKPYTYTYGTPNTTTETRSKAEQYKTIFNMINRDDLVPYIPLSSWGLCRYGTDIYTSVEENYRDEWVTDNMTAMLLGYTNDYAKALRSYDPDNGLVAVLGSMIDGLTLNIAEYKSASGYRAEEFLPGVFSKYPVHREGVFEFNDIVWLPQNIADDYRPYYVDCDYGELPNESEDDEVQKKAFNTFAEVLNCKRVKISPMFSMYTMSKLMKGLMDSVGTIKADEIVDKLKELICFIDANENEQEFDTCFLKKLLDESEMDEDILNMLYMMLVTFNCKVESGPAFVDAMQKISDAKMGAGFIFAHMPTTYYFLASQRIESKDITPDRTKAKRGDEYKMSGNTYKITSVNKQTVSLVKAGNAAIVFIPDEVYIEGIPYKVTSLGPESFKASEAKSVIVGTKYLTKKEVKSAFKNSDVNKIIIMVGDIVQNVKYLKEYSDFFKKSIVGKKVNLMTN